MKAQFNLLGKQTGFLITTEEADKLRSIVNKMKASKSKFDALAILRDDNKQ